MINIAGIVHNDLANGPGVRCTVFVQGCKHGCKGCHNPETWKVGAGKNMTADDIFTEITSNKLDTEVTISGGEPVDQYKAIDYAKVPILALKKYKKAWLRNDKKRYQAYINAAGTDKKTKSNKVTNLEDVLNNDKYKPIRDLFELCKKY